MIFLLLGAGIFSPVSNSKNQIDSVRIWPSPNNTRLVLDLAEQPKFSYFTLKNPDRLVIDLANAKKGFDLSNFKNSSKLIKRIRHSTPKKPNSIRLVVELNKAAKAQLFALPPTPPYSNRLVIDFNQGETAPQQVLLDSQQNDSNRDIVIAVDAGHGGEDPGSIGPGGTYEKTITLSVAKKLAALINKEKGLKAVQTRSGDYFVSVNRRPEIARKNKADLFISIHADAFTTPQPRGASVWVLSMKRANSELGRWLEKKERHSELLGGAAEVIKDTANEKYLAAALLDMSMDHSMATSYNLSYRVIKQLKKVTRLHKKAPNAANFGVLTSPDIPSILIEIGFISNPQEEKNLNWSRFRANMANSIFVALKNYFRQAPPDGTLWAKRRSEQNRTHKVRSGESLSLLAKRYKVRVRDIKQANNLRSDRVKIGQVLTIPRS